MKKLVEVWYYGLYYLAEDDLISFFACFTAILTEISFLWAMNTNNAMYFTLLLLGCIANIIISAAWKGIAKGTKGELVQTKVYFVIWVLLFIIGCFKGIFKSFLLFAIPLIFTYISIIIRHQQRNITVGCSKKVRTTKLYKIFSNPIVYDTTYMLITVVPITLFLISINLTSLPVYLKVLLSIGYALIMPFIVYMEDTLAAGDVFELFKLSVFYDYYKNRGFKKK